METLELAQQHPVLAIVAIGLAVYTVFSSLLSRQKFPKDLPWVGKQDGALFAVTKAKFSSMNNTGSWLADGYAKVCTLNIVATFA
jgi:hypothetical protein